MVEVIYFFAMCIFDLDCMSLLGNVHTLCIISKEITLIGKKFENFIL
jgi:hypothetical protein